MISNALHIVDLITTNEDKKYEPVGRMASMIITITQEQGGCLPQDLNAKGFTPDEVAKNWHMALAIAAVELNQMNINPNYFKQTTRRK